MNVFEIFHTKEFDTKTILKRNGKNLSLQEFKEFISVAVNFLNSQSCKNAVVLSSDAFDFVVWFFACIAAKKEIFLLTDSSKLKYLEFEYVLLDKILDKKCDKNIEYDPIDCHKVSINFFTSGSTSKPKMITKTLTNTIIEAEDVFAEFLSDYKNPFRVLTSTKSQHMFPFIYYFILPLVYCEKLLMDTTDVCYPDDADFKDSMFVSTPSFLEKFEKYNVKNEYSPYVIFTAGAKIKDSVRKYLEQDSTVIDIYGSTETGTVAFKRHSSENTLTCMKSVEIEPDENSQIVVKSPYFIETSCTLGDIVNIVDKKSFILMNRADRILKIQEKRISAPEVEEIVQKNSFVQECFCFKSAEKLACAVALSKEGIDFFFENGFCYTKIISYLKNYLNGKVEIVPQKWKFLYEIPKTVTGKIDKAKIEQIFATNVSMPFVFDVKKDSDYVEYGVVFPKSCNFFEGHFTNFPVLPGVVQLYFANYFAQEAFGVKVSTESVKKIKFSKIIKPDEKLTLIFEKKGNSITYTYKKDEQICSGGVMTVNEKD